MQHLARNEQDFNEECNGEDTSLLPLNRDYKRRERKTNNPVLSVAAVILGLTVNSIATCICIKFLFNEVRQLKSFSATTERITSSQILSQSVGTTTPTLLVSLSETGSKRTKPATNSDGSKNNRTILILYLDGHLHQQSMAEEIQYGVLSACSKGTEKSEQFPCTSTTTLEAKLMTYGQSSFSDVLSADAVILGSPVYNANVHPDVQREMAEKIGAAFVTAGGISAGEEGTMLSLIRAMLVFQMICVGGDTWEAAFGASAIVDEDPFGSYHEIAGEGRKSSRTSWFAKECYDKESPGTNPAQPRVNAMFLKKAFGLGARVGRLALLLNTNS